MIQNKGKSNVGTCISKTGMIASRKKNGFDHSKIFFESERQRAESQWIVAARSLCHLQYPDDHSKIEDTH